MGKNMEIEMETEMPSGIIRISVFEECGGC